MLVPINFADIRRKKKIEKKEEEEEEECWDRNSFPTIWFLVLLMILFFWLGAGIRDEEVDQLLFVCLFVCF